ncbi:hypothetical protein Tco_0530579, partial [Tanacetum coccineum]
RARTEFTTLAFEQFRANISAGVLPHTVVPEPAGLSVAADKGKAPMPELDIPAEFLAEDAQARKRFEEEQASEQLVQRLWAEDLAEEDLPNVSEERAKELDDLMMRMTETKWLNLMMQVSSNPALARELLGADVTEENFIERMTAIKEKKKRALADLRYRALKGKPMKQSEPAISEPPSKRQRVERGTSQPSSVPAATTQPADDPDSAGGGSSHPAGSATPLSGSAAPNTTGGAFGAIITDSTVTTTIAMDSAGSYRNIRVSPFADSAAGVAADPDSDDEVLAEIIFRGKSISGDGVVLVDKLPDDEIVDQQVKAKPVEDFFSSESESDDDMENYIPSLPYGASKDWEISLHSDDVEDFWRTQDDWIVSSWQLYPKSSVHVLDLTNGKTVYMFVDKVYPIRATLLERMLRHRFTVPPSYCRDVVVAGNIIQTVQTGLRQSYECPCIAPYVCLPTARHGFQLTMAKPKKEFWLPLQTLWFVSHNPLIDVRVCKNSLWPWISHVLANKEWLVQEGTALVASPSANYSCWLSPEPNGTVSAACSVAAGYTVSASLMMLLLTLFVLLSSSCFEILTTDEVDLEEFDLKNALFSHMNKKKSANKNTTYSVVDHQDLNLGVRVT